MARSRDCENGPHERVDAFAVCGAKGRGGKPCQKRPLKGKTRCKLHGGSSPGTPIPGNRSAATPGSLYSKFLTPEEVEVFDTITLGSLEDELRLTRIRLARALRAEQDSNGEPEAESYSSTRADGGEMFAGATHSETVTNKVRDYVGIIDRLTARIATLESAILDMNVKRLALDLGELDKKIKGAQARDADKGDGVTGFTFTVRRLTAET